LYELAKSQDEDMRLEMAYRTYTWELASAVLDRDFDTLKRIAKEYRVDENKLLELVERRLKSVKDHVRVVVKG